MREVHIYCADPLRPGAAEAEAIVIRIQGRAPAIEYGDSDFTRKAGERFASEGAALAEAIWSSCAGGTIDALIAALLTRRASQFRVAFPQETNSNV